MTKEEFSNIRKFIKANFQYAEFLNDNDSMVLLFNSLNRYDYEIVKGAADDIVRDGQYDVVGKREMFTMENFIRAVERKATDLKRQKAELPEQFCAKCRGSKCKLKMCHFLYQKGGKGDGAPTCFCRGNGCTFYVTSDGNEYIRPTDCDRGRHNYPWYFNKDTFEQIKHGVN